MPRVDVYLRIRKESTGEIVTAGVASKPMAQSSGLSGGRTADLHFQLDVDASIFEAFRTGVVIKVAPPELDAVAVVAGLRNVKAEIREMDV